MTAYLKRAAEHFGVEKYIHFNTYVVKVRETTDHEATGQWEVYTRPSDQGTPDLSGQTEPMEDVLAKCCKEIFDCVIVCSGWFKEPMYPVIPGMDAFQGIIAHSFSYSDPRVYDGKKVLVVGNRFSASEVACDVSSHAEETYLALGVGTWIIPRLCHGGRPIDRNVSRRTLYSRHAKAAIDANYLREARSRMDHTKSGVGTSQTPTMSALCISDELPIKFASGKIKPYGRLAQLTETAAIFKEGQTIEDLDAVVFCTGYKTGAPFLDVKYREGDGTVRLYMQVFPLNRKHNTLGIIGHFTTNGPQVPMNECQARFAAAVMAGNHALPSQAAMTCDVDTWCHISLSSSSRRGYHSFRVPCYVYMDHIGQAMGFYPSFWKLLPRDPLLACRTWFGPYLAAQYRLLGPGSDWHKAREVCYTGYHEDLGCVRNAEAKSLTEGSGARGAARMLLYSSFFVVAAAAAIWFPDRSRSLLASVE